MFGEGLNLGSSYTFNYSQSDASTTLAVRHSGVSAATAPIDPDPALTRAIIQSNTEESVRKKRVNKIDTIIQHAGYRRIAILGDGECFYRSAAIHFFSDESQFSRLRHLAAKWCLLNFPLLQRIQHDEGNEILLNELSHYPSADIAFDLMNTAKRYAESLDIICLANLLNRTILVATMEAITTTFRIDFNTIGVPFNSYRSHPDYIIIPCIPLNCSIHMEDIDTRPLELLFINGNHYEILVKIQDVDLINKYWSESRGIKTNAAKLLQKRKERESLSPSQRLRVKDVDKSSKKRAYTRRLDSISDVTSVVGANSNADLIIRPKLGSSSRSRPKTHDQLPEGSATSLNLEFLSKDATYLNDLKEFNQKLLVTSTLLNCSVCGEQLPVCDMTETIYDTVHHAHLLEPLYINAQYRLVPDLTADIRICKYCYSSLKAKALPPFSFANCFNFGAVPECLRDLTFIEKRMISIAVPFQTIYYRHIHEGGQGMTKGHLINFMNEINHVVTQLPRYVSDTGVYMVQSEGPGSRVSQRQRYRPAVVLNALLWLKQNNPFYHCVEIDESRLRVEIQQEQSIDTNIIHNEVSDNPSIDSEVISCTSTDSDEEFALDTTVPEMYVHAPDDVVQDQARDLVMELSLQNRNNLNTGSTSNDTNRVLKLKRLTRIANEYENKNLLLLCFPWLFPYGRGGLEDLSRASRIPTRAAYFKHLLQYHDRRFAQDHQLLFWMLNTTLRTRAGGSMGLAASRTTATNNAPVTAGDLRQAVATRRIDSELSHDLLDTVVNKNPPSNSTVLARQLFNRIIPFSRSLPGTAAHMSLHRRNLLSMISASTSLPVPVPTFFFTLSSADLYWPELFRMIQPGITQEQLDSLSVLERKALLAQNPVLAAIHFRNRVQATVANIIQGSYMPLGRVVDYWFRIESQMRGSLHLHGLLWVEEMKDVTELLETEEGRKVIAQFVDKHISATLPSIPSSDSEQETNGGNINSTINVDVNSFLKKAVVDRVTTEMQRMCPISEPESAPIINRIINIVKSTNMHQCGRTCFKNNKASSHTKEKPHGPCRFKFPKEVRKHTVIEYKVIDDNPTGVDINVHSDTRAQNYKQSSSADGSTTSLNSASLRSKRAVMRCHLKRSDAQLNNYNPMLAATWAANTDVSFIANPYGTAIYVAKYAAKRDKADQSVLTGEIEKAISRLPASTDLKRVLQIVSNADIGCREFSAQEAAYILLGLPLVEMSREIVTVDVAVPSERSIRLKLPEQLEQLDDNNANIEEAGPFSKKGMHDNYSARPDLEEFNNMTLHEFASKYRIVKNTKTSTVAADVVRESLSEARASLPRYTLQNKRVITQRRIAAIVNPLPYIKIDIADHRSCYSLLLLYVPWRDKDQLDGLSPTELIQLMEVSVRLLPEHVLQSLKLQAVVQDVISEPYVVPVEPFVVDDVNVSEPRNSSGDSSEKLYNSDNININPLDDLDNSAYDEQLFNDNSESNETKTDPELAMEISEAEQAFGINDHQYTPNLYRASNNELLKMKAFVPELLRLRREMKAEKRQLLTAGIGIQTGSTLLSNEVSSYRAELEQKLIDSAEMLNEKQELAVRFVINAMENDKQLLLIITGSGGTGKSFLINTIVKYAELFHESGQGLYGPVVIVAPTGAAAYNVGGYTIHHVFHLKPDLSGSGTDEKITKNMALTLQKELKGLEILIIDEYSLMDTNLLSRIDSRLRVAFPEFANVPFGNRHVIACGDFWQLCPVGGRGLYNDKPSMGRSLWLTFNRVIELNVQQRQKAEQRGFINALNRARIGETTSEDIALFNSRYRNANIIRASVPSDTLWAAATKAKVAQINSTCLEVLTSKEVVINVYARHLQISEGGAVASTTYSSNNNNNDIVASVDLSTDPEIVNVEPIDTGTSTDIEAYWAPHSDRMGDNSKPKKARQLMPVTSSSVRRDLLAYVSKYEKSVFMPHLELAIGARVLLTTNEAVPLGLVNGAMGTIRQIVYSKSALAGPAYPRISFEEAVTMSEQPQIPVVLVQFDAQFYNGPSYLTDIPRVVPIIAKQTQIRPKHQSYERLQLPLVLAWGLTIHKTQGRTSDNLVFDPEGLFTRGQAYVACSRVRTLEGLHLLEYLNENSFKVSSDDGKSVKTEMARLRELEVTTIIEAEALNSVTNSINYK